MMTHSESEVIAAIDELERDDIDKIVDWQMTESPAAKTEGRSPRPLYVDQVVSVQMRVNTDGGDPLRRARRAIAAMWDFANEVTGGRLGHYADFVIMDEGRDVSQ